MANLSSASGTIRVDKVGKEFLEFVRTVQHDDAYYTLVDNDDIAGLHPTENGDLEFSFSTAGRWNYNSNLEGYLEGNWLGRPQDKEAHAKFIEALKEKGGSVEVEYFDSDSAMDWMGEGVYKVSVQNGEVDFSEDFEEERVSVAKYAELTGNSIFDSFDILHSYESAEAYQKHVEERKKGGKEPSDPDFWYDNEYEEE